ncbi:MAG: hypothetical protein IJE25_04760 [Clostridia bacterium]|nr:hypothetical protein [Clostridia bacterium]
MKLRNSRLVASLGRLGSRLGRTAHRLWNKLLSPKVRTLFFVYPIALFFIAASLVFLLLDFTSSDYLSIIAYVCFGFAALLLAYSVYTAVIFGPSLVRIVKARILKNPIAARLALNWGFRTLVTATISFGVSILNAAFNAYLGITERSIWFGVLACYYIFFALMRGGVLLFHRKNSSGDSDATLAAKNYRNCGIKLLLLNLTLSSAIAQMIFDDRAFSYKDWFIFAFAAYAFYKIAQAIRNFLKARKQDVLTIRAIRDIGLIDAAVSILALQTALLHTFSSGEVNVSAFNTLTGSVVSIFTVTMSILMIRRGAREVRASKTALSE